MASDATRLRFANFELDRKAETLLRDGVAVRIQPQPLRVLWILATHSGHLVSREELRTSIWDTATFVEFDQSLNYCIRQIRLALHDDAATPMFVETVKRRGYRFVAAVEAIADGRASMPAPIEEATVAAAPPARFEWRRAVAIATVGAGVIAALAARVPVRSGPSGPSYTQLTSFSDAAFSPALSPDGRMVAFIVGSDTSFPTTGEIYTKLLPNGDPIQRTHDAYRKYGVAFSPDGSELTYTAAEPTHGWSTAVLPVLGGESRLLLPNAAGLTWLDEHHYLFGEIKTGLHMGLVTASDNRENLRDVYLPAHERGMAHYGYASPDRRSILVVEMGPTGAWQRCRLVPFDGGSQGTEIGPDGPCTSAAWSPDGDWMYFTAVVKGASHVWRQRFPNGDLEQITSGPAEERGVAVNHDGRSILTSLGIRESGVWLHDAGGEHLVHSEGYATRPSFSSDGRFLYYLLRRVSSPSNELWVTDLTTRQNEPLVEGFAITGYDVSSDGRRIVFATIAKDGVNQVWLALRERTSAPHMLLASADSPYFAFNGSVIARLSEGGNNYLVQLTADGANASRVTRSPIDELKGVSPDGRWAIAMMPVDDVPTTAVLAIPLEGGPSTRICPANCMAKWSPDGTRLYVQPFLEGRESGRAVLVPTSQGRWFNGLPPGGIASANSFAGSVGTVSVDLTPFDPGQTGRDVAPGPTPDVFAYTRSVTHRNLFQIQLP